ncbi:hypothetical protein NDU88_005773 [Pleurodeles waltl]|uniref:Uncharacterized protein n=1 Tax=Pleurodeles waltl TaxID=8319 RepID=A0AAV7RKL9_PLEWA|nr:hypothetical protein NDU88_005773 [Pleurodeles waltl]
MPRILCERASSWCRILTAVHAACALARIAFRQRRRHGLRELERSSKAHDGRCRGRDHVRAQAALEPSQAASASRGSTIRQGLAHCTSFLVVIRCLCFFLSHTAVTAADGRDAVQ